MDWQKSIAGRLERLHNWCAGRNFDISGYRDKYIHICAVLLVMQNCENLANELKKRNNELTCPLPETEVATIVKSAEAHRYVYSNAKIAEVLNMTEEESKSFCVKLTPWQLAQLYGDTRKPNRKRNEERAARKAEKAKLYAQIPGLLAQGMSESEVGRQLGLSKSTVHNHKSGA